MSVKLHVVVLYLLLKSVQGLYLFDYINLAGAVS